MARPRAPRGQGRARVVAAALELFADHGVSGTSLQNIADHLGVQKAAVYYQFRTKEEIVMAVLAPGFVALEEVVEVAERQDGSAAATDATITGLAALVIEQRSVMATLFRDPEALRLLEASTAYPRLAARVSELLLGPDPDPRRRVAVSVFGNGLVYAGIDPSLADVTETQLRESLVELGRSLLG